MSDTDPARADSIANPAQASSRPAWFNWWPILIGPAGIVFVYIASALHWNAVLHKANLENVGVVLTVSTAVALAFRSSVTRQPAYIVLTALAIAIACREIHWDWTKKTVYVAVAAIGIWGLVWRHRIQPFFSERPRTWIWLVATGSVYVLSQVIARRAFRHVLPDEQALHIPLEEIAETLAHSMLLFFAVAPPFTKKSGKNDRS